MRVFLQLRASQLDWTRAQRKHGMRNVRKVVCSQVMRNLAIPIPIPSVVAMPMYKIVTIVDLRRVGHSAIGAAVMVVRMPWRTHQVHGQDKHQHPMQ